VLAKGIGGVCLAVSVYYARFFALRAEPFTLVQIVILLVAAVLLLTTRAPEQPASLSWQLVVLGLAAVAMGVALFMVVDGASHSASDTLNGVVPSEALLTALVVRLRSDLGNRRATN
jgi:hypothetical protein